MSEVKWRVEVLSRKFPLAPQCSSACTSLSYSLSLFLSLSQVSHSLFVIDPIYDCVIINVRIERDNLQAQKHTKTLSLERSREQAPVLRGSLTCRKKESRWCRSHSVRWRFPSVYAKTWQLLLLHVPTKCKTGDNEDPSLACLSFPDSRHQTY